MIKINASLVLLTICTLLIIVVVYMSILKKDYKQTIEFLIGYMGLLLCFFQSTIANWIVKLF